MNHIGRERNPSSKNKTHYFSQLALRLKKAIALHGHLLWEWEIKLEDWKTSPIRLKEEFKDFSNVTKHCLVVAARSWELAEQMWLSDEMIYSLMLAAILHDVGKKIETETVTKQWFGWAAFDIAWDIQTRLLQDRGFSEDVVFLSAWAGHTAFEDVRNILSKWDTISEREKAFLILHYIDNCTLWDTEFKSGTNPLQERIKKNQGNPRYILLNMQGTSRFWQPTFDEQLELWGKLDKWFQKHLAKWNIPELIQEGIKKKIERLKIK